MPETMLAVANLDYGGYISIVKLLVFVAFFIPLVPLLDWIFADAEAVGENSTKWAGIIFGAAILSIIVWLFVGMFSIGIIFYIGSVGACSFIYLKKRDSQVIEPNRVLTMSAFMSLFSRGGTQKVKVDNTMVFYTANKNEVPRPEPKTTDSFGYRFAITLFEDVIAKRATSILLSSTQQGYNVSYEIDGVGSKQPESEKEQTDYFIKFIKMVGDLDINERRKPQKSIFKIEQTGKTYEWQITCAGSATGEHVQFKLLTSDQFLKLEDLSLPNEQFTVLKEIRDLKQGVFIISGPKKSGLTTTFYALMRNHDPYMNNINTLELEPSSEILDITQEKFKPDENYRTYDQKLMAVARMGPDVLGVADCKDAQSAKICATSGSEKKIIYVALEADSVTNALGRWIKMVGNVSDAVMPLIGVSNQKLIRILCEDCKQAYMPETAILRKFNIPQDKAKALYRAGKVQYDKHGKPFTCETCSGTGYVGRTAVFEMIKFDDKLKNAIAPLTSLQEIGKQLRNAKMLYLQEQMLRKVLAGTTSINEIVRVLSKPQSKQKKPKK